MSTITVCGPVGSGITSSTGSGITSSTGSGITSSTGSVTGSGSDSISWVGADSLTSAAKSANGSVWASGSSIVGVVVVGAAACGAEVPTLRSWPPAPAKAIATPIATIAIDHPIAALSTVVIIDRVLREC